MIPLKTEKNILIAFLLNLFFSVFEFFGIITSITDAKKPCHLDGWHGFLCVLVVEQLQGFKLTFAFAVDTVKALHVIKTVA